MLAMDPLFEAFIDEVADRVATRLGLRPPVKAVERDTTPTGPSGPSQTPTNMAEYLSPREAAEVLGLTVKGLEGMRATGRGPKYVKIGGRVRYRRGDLG